MRTLTILLSLVAAILITSSVKASNTDSTRVDKKIIKTVMITDDGKVMVDSVFITEGDSTQMMVFKNHDCKHQGMRHMDNGMPKHKKMMMHQNSDEMPCPPPPPPPPAPGHFLKHQGMIDLNDPSVISFEKKDMKDGTEKITIIRKSE